MAQTADLLQGQQPLNGVVLCCTSVPQDVRTHLAGIATEMGAMHKLDLTSDVTHLIVGSITTPKYQYVARERPDIKVLLPSWLEEARTLWMDGADVDIAALEEKHHCPPFFGLQICLTGFDGLDQRTYISSTVAQQGATYHGDLTKAVTHLIAATPQGQKYTHAKKWEITIVSLKWFEDSVRRGMALDESFYDPTMPLEEQGKGAFKRQRTSLGKHGREHAPAKAAVPDPARKRLRRTASTRLESQSQDMWQDMSADPVKMDDANNDSWRDDRSHSSMDTLAPTSRTDPKTTLDTAKHASRDMLQETDKVGALFSGHYILIHGFDKQKTSRLEQVLRDNGATITETAAELEDASNWPLFEERCLLIPHDASSAVTDLPRVPAGTILATEWWIERCVYHRRVLDPVTDALSCPLGDSKVSGFSNLLISTTGFSGVDLRQVAEAVKLIGATYQEKVLPNSAVIVCGSAEIRKEKAFYASKHQIPVVSADWLWDSLKTKRHAPFNQYAKVLPSVDRQQFNETSSTANSARREGGDTNRRDGRKDDIKRLSSSRKRQITPSLALHAPRVSTTANMPRANAIFYEDEDDPALEGRVTNPPPLPTARQAEPQALREVSPNLSPSKGNKEGTQADWRGEDTVKPSSCSVPPSKAPSERVAPPQEMEATTRDPQMQAPRTHHELTADLAGLLQRTGSSRPNSSGPADVPVKRKNRPLGRASSGTSSRSFSASAPAQSQNSPHRHTAIDSEEVDGMNAGHNTLMPPSTQLGYETLETQAHRLHMSKKMGTKLHDESDGRRVPSLGVVKDTSLMADVGVGTRVKGRGRAK